MLGGRGGNRSIGGKKWQPNFTANFSIPSPLRTYVPVRARRLKLFGHVARADKSQDHSRALRVCIWHTPKNWKRRLGRPRHTWLRTVEADLRPFNLGLASGFKKAQDRTTWLALTGTATSPTSPE